ARGIALGVDVGDLLQLQCPFERQREGAAAAEIEHIARLGYLERDFADALVMVQDLARPRRDRGQEADELPLAGMGDRPPRSRQGDGKAGEYGELRRERLGRGDADFGTGQGRQYDIGLASDRAFGLVDDGDDLLTLRLGVAQRRQSVGRLARLRDKDRSTTL